MMGRHGGMGERVGPRAREWQAMLQVESWLMTASSGGAAGARNHTPPPPSHSEGEHTFLEP